MQAEDADVTYQTDRGPVTAHFSGVLLWSLIAGGGAVSTTTARARNCAMRSASTAKGRLCRRDLDRRNRPVFGGKSVLVAYERDGKPLDGFRIVMPGDKHGGRNVRDVTTIGVE